MELYYGRMSGNSSRAMFGLEAAGVSYTPRLLDTTRSENQAAAYTAINPMGKIPALVDGEFHLWESNAINWYAAETNPAARLLPQTAQGRAGVQRWMFFQTAHVSPPALAIVRATHPGMRAHWKFTFDASTADPARKELERYMKVLDGALAGRDFLEGDFSLADIAMTPHLHLLSGSDYTLPRNVAAWLARTTAHPAWQRTAARIFG